MCSISKVNDFIIEFEEAIHNNNAAVFCGAGTSIDSGFVNWKELLRPAATKMSLDIDKESDLIEVAQYFVNEHRNNKQPLLDLLQKQFTKSKKENKLLKELVALPIHNYWTTNYDHEIENYLTKNDRRALTICKNSDFNLDYSNYTDRVFKFHGDIYDICNCVITRDDYKNFPHTHQMFINALTGQLTEKTFVFLGYSFQDPDFSDLIATLSVIMNGNVRQHYYIDKKINWKSEENKLEESDLSKNEKKKIEKKIADLKYLKIKQELASGDRLRFGIQTILVEDFDQIPPILEKVRVRNLTRKIFVAGSNRECPEGWDKKNSYDFLNELGRELVKNRFLVSTGSIRGLEPLVAGVLEQINFDDLSSDDYLKIQQLPRINESTNHMEKSSKKRYQKDMLKNVGIVLFLFGNQTYDNGVTFEPARGVLSEFERAKKIGNYIIPLPQTGGASQLIFQEIKNNISDYPYLESYVKEIESGDNSEEFLIQTLVKTIRFIHETQSTFL